MRDLERQIQWVEERTGDQVTDKDRTTAMEEEIVYYSQHRPRQKHSLRQWPGDEQFVIMSQVGKGNHEASQTHVKATE